MTDDAVTAHIPYGSILLFHKSFLTEYGSCDNTQAADAEQDDPEIHHAVVAGLRAVRIGRKTYVVLTYVALAVGVFILVSRCVGLVAASTFVPMVILIGFPIGTVCMGVSKSRSDLKAADRALDRIGLGCRFTIGSMSCLAAIDHNATACNRTDMPVTGCVLLPFGAFGMTESLAGGEGFGTLLTALTGLVVLGRIGAVCLACKVPVCNYFLVEYVGMTELSFDLKLTDGTLDRIFFGCAALMIGGMCSEVFRLGTTCRVALVPVTVCATFPSSGVPIVVSNSTVGYAAIVTNGCLLTGSNVGTGRRVFSLGAIDYDAATNNGAFFPVMRSVGRPNIGRSMSTCGNGLTVTDDLVTAKALGVAGVTVGLCLVVCFGLVDKSSAANVSAGNLIAVEGMAVVVFYITASGAGIEVNSNVTAVAGSLQCFCLLRLSSIAVRSKIAVRLTTHGTNSLCSTGCCSSGVLTGELTKGYLRNFGCSVSHEELTAIVTLYVSIPTLVFTVGSLLRNGSFVCVGARNGYHAGVGEVAVCCGDGDGCRAFLYAGNLTGCFVYGGNSRVVRLKRNGLVRSFCRINGVTRGLRLTCLER